MNVSDTVDFPLWIGKFREYLHKPEGRYYSSYLQDQDPREVRDILFRLQNLSKTSDEFVKLVLYGLLPCRDTTYAERGIVIPINQDMKRLFSKYHYTEDQRKKLASSIYRLVLDVNKKPNKLDSLIRKFKTNELSAGIESWAVSPTFSALSPSFPVVNSKVTRSYATISKLVLGQRDRLSGDLEGYSSDAAKLEELKNVLVHQCNFIEAKNHEILYLFLFWISTYVKIREDRIEFEEPQGPGTIVHPIDQDKVNTFLEMAKGPQPSGYPVELLKTMDNKGTIVYNSEFQRGEVWNRAKKQKLIDSMLRGYNINTVFFRHLPGGKFECLDGQQRLKTILKEFLENKFPISPKITPEFNKPTLFRELPKLLQNSITNYMIYAVTLHSLDDAETCRVFLRLQEGLPLNSAEKLNAMLGPLRDRVVQASKLPFIANLDISNHRFAHRYIVAQAFLLTQANQLTEATSKFLEPLYMNTKQSEATSLFHNVKKVMTFLDSEFSEDAGIIESNGDFISLFWLGKYLSENYVTNVQKLGLKDFFLDFITRVKAIKSGEIKEEDPYYDYKIYRRGAIASKKSMEERFDVLLTQFLQLNPTLVRKDATRFFNDYEKLTVYKRDKGICKLCHSRVAFDKGTVDHVKPFAQGGSTAIENGQWACVPCNQKKLAKYEESTSNCQ